ncbi:MAG: CBS domain-containing protein [Desulfobacterales bacterium]
MFISKSMTPKVVTVREDTVVISARELMVKHRIRHLPVIDEDDRLIGMVSDRDIRSALPRKVYTAIAEGQPVDDVEGIRVAEIMTRDPVSISPHNTIEDALLMLQGLRVGALPVVDRDHRLVGIISVRDLLRAFIAVLGIEEPGTLLCILVEEKIGQMKKIVDTITAENISFGSILVARYWEENMRAVFPYLLTNNVRTVKKKLEAQGFRLLDPMEWTMDRIPRHDPKSR